MGLLRAAALAMLLACTPSPSPSPSPAPTPSPSPSPSRSPGDALAAARTQVTALAAALRASDARAVAAIADREVGLTFWSQPGAYPRPAGTLTPAGPALPADPHPGYYAELADLLDLGAPIATVDAAPYVLPPEEELPSAPPWATLRTHGVDLLRHVPDPEDQPRARTHPVRYELHIERGYRSVHVYFTDPGTDRGELRISDVMVWTHYDA